MNRPMLGLKRDEVKLVQHDPLWKEEFEQIQEQIMQVLPQLRTEQIQHIGSTAIMDIQAKPVIDIALGVEDFAEQRCHAEEPLRTIGFYRLRVQRQQEIVFARFTDSTYEVKTHFIHLIPFESEHWKNMLFFRDYLNAHAEMRMEYERLKQSFTMDQGDIEQYTEHKEQWIQHIFTKRVAD
ncbi:GrpB family protein [Paenibacillus hunanensis]|uniref:GrpB family protein n=1 Tax=Paenibacillus hunanensis TaxID=539262 RepID=UPI002A6A127D|nr:GrpB family protein [Paenibacillus hunanensis]WPP39378.1 GrpB family protein [Paenibacillus hunanensis]